MREILFRGKRVDNGEWVEGYITEHTMIPHDMQSYIGWVIECKETALYEYNWYEVDPATIGQYTGLKDKNGKRIFEGDVVKAQDNLIFSPFCDGLVGKVVYIETAFFIEPKDPTKSEYLFNECAVYEVLGNIHDNPELMEVR